MAAGWLPSSRSECTDGTMARQIKWGILGSGPIAQAYATAIAAQPRSSVCAVASRSAGRAQRFAEPWPGCRPYDDYERAIVESDADIFYVATATGTHERLVERCIDRGRAVLCEKPFVTNASAARRLTERARRANVFLMEAMWSRFVPGITEAKRLIAEGRLGDVRHAEATFGFIGTAEGLGARLLPGPGAGVLLDLGVYPISLISYLLGDIARATGADLRTDQGVDAHAAFTLEGARGFTAACTVSFQVTLPCTMTFYGTRGKLALRSPMNNPRGLWLTLDPERGAPPEWIRARPLLAKNYLRYQNRVQPLISGRTRYIPASSKGSGFRYELDHVVECLDRGATESDIMPHEATVHVQGVMDELRRSHLPARQVVDKGEHP